MVIKFILSLFWRFWRHLPCWLSSRAMTLTEMVVGMAVMGVLALVLSALLRVAFHATTTTQASSTAQEEVRQALNKLESDFYSMNEISISSATFIELVCDWDENSSYNRSGDQDADGVPNFRDGDRDGDANLIAPATAQWRVGFNLKDDDEDGDNRIDVVLRYWLENKILYKDTSYNQSTWNTRKVKLLEHVTLFRLYYYGNKANDLGRNIDLGSDGLVNTNDSGENDGIITEQEMDMVASPRGMGNRSGRLDTKNERRYVTSIRVLLGVDKNNDGTNDYQVTTEIYPPLLVLKNK